MLSSLQSGSSLEPNGCRVLAPTTPDRAIRYGSPSFSENTDDAAIFAFDSLDSVTAQMITSSPSAIAILTPQKPETNGSLACSPAPLSDETDLMCGEYDSDRLGSLGRRKNSKRNAGSCTPVQSKPNYLATRKAKSEDRGVLGNITNTCGHFSKTKPSNVQRRLSNGQKGEHMLDNSPNRSFEIQGRDPKSFSPAPRRLMSPQGNDQFSYVTERDGSGVTLAQYHKIERERNRFEKMYEHQKALYIAMRERFTEFYRTYQQKIEDNIALTSRLEVCRNVCNQLKKNCATDKEGIVLAENKALQRKKPEILIEKAKEAEIANELRTEEFQTKLAAVDGLFNDLRCILDDYEDHIHISQLDSLLKASYTKTTMLFSSLQQQRRSYDALVEDKLQLEQKLLLAIRERQESEAKFMKELHRREKECERLYEQSESQQQSILNLRQMLIRFLDPGSGSDSSRVVEESFDEESSDESHAGFKSREGSIVKCFSRNENSNSADDTAMTMPEVWPAMPSVCRMDAEVLQHSNEEGKEYQEVKATSESSIASL